jgi:hypothetical protein
MSHTHDTDGNPVDRWDPAVLARLDAFVDGCARELGGRPPGPLAPFAVFDWDHTLYHGDIGDALFLHLVRHRLLCRPSSWEETSPHLTPAARAVLEAGTDDGPLQPARPELARELIHIYLHHRTCDGLPAFAGYDPATTHPSYAWCASLLAGRTIGEIAGLTAEVLDHLAARPAGATGAWEGLSGWEDWGRFAGPMVQLARRLQDAGLPVWIVSASPQPVVETCAARAGLTPAGVIGVRNRTDGAGILLPCLEPCGGTADVIPYCLGKRAWIQRIIGGRSDPDPGRPDEALSARLWFAAGDSDGDLAFLQDATRLRLVVAHRDNRAVRLARENADGRWLLNPPFFPA